MQELEEALPSANLCSPPHILHLFKGLIALCQAEPKAAFNHTQLLLGSAEINSKKKKRKS